MCVWAIALSYQNACFRSRIQRWLQGDINLGLCEFIGCLHTYKARWKVFAHFSDTVNTCSMTCNTRWQYHLISWCSVCRSFSECFDDGQSMTRPHIRLNLCIRLSSTLILKFLLQAEIPQVVIEEVACLFLLFLQQ